MNLTELQAALPRLGLYTTRDTADLFGLNHSTIVRRLTGRRRIPPEFAILIRLLLAGKITQADVTDALRRR